VSGGSDVRRAAADQKNAKKIRTLTQAGLADAALASMALVVVHHPLQGLGIQDANMALLDFDSPVFHELGEGAADGFELETQVAANLFACHAQNQFGL
jgi:hypothetical protein